MACPARWDIYIAHDPCHDTKDEGGEYIADRNTVIAFSTNGSWRILGRELPRNIALEIAFGEEGTIRFE